MPTSMLALPCELLENILSLLPPDDPRTLFRASAVCKSWRALLTDAAFGSRYRKLHRTPPVLGLVDEDNTFGSWFTSLSPSSPFLPVHPSSSLLRPRDSRHGLVLLEAFEDVDSHENPSSFIVWDPLVHRQWELHCPEIAANPDIDYSLAVACAAIGCSHLDCHGGPFFVAFVGTDSIGDFTYACLYSSEARTWSSVTSCKCPELIDLVSVATERTHVLVGNTLYFSSAPSEIIVRYNLVTRDLSMIDMPFDWPFPDYDLIAIEDEVLGLAYVESRQRICLWLMEAGPDGTKDWAEHYRVIELQELLPPRPNFLYAKLFVIGCAEGASVLFLNTMPSVYAIDLKSGHVKKVLSTGRDSRAFPYMRFYTPDQARCITPPAPMAFSMENTEVAQGEDHVALLSQPSSKEEEKWEDDANEEETRGNGGAEPLRMAQEFFVKGSKAIKEGDLASAVKHLDDALRIRVAYCGRLGLSCVNTYYEYGYALLLLHKSRPKREPYWERYNNGKNELNLAWKMFHIASAILGKSPGSTIEKVQTFNALALVSMEKEEIDHALSFCSRSLAILEHLIDGDLLQIVQLDLYVCMALVFVSRIGYSSPYCAKIVCLCKSYVENMENAGAAGEGGSEKSSSLDDEMKFLTELKKTLQGLEQTMSTTQTREASGVVPSFTSRRWLHHEIAWTFLDSFVDTIPRRLRELIHHVSELVAAPSLTI